jgi:hypothetical protein
MIQHKKNNTFPSVIVNSHVENNSSENNSQEITTISTLEIANLTSKQHRHVLRDCEKMFTTLEIDSAQFWTQYNDQSGKANLMYILNKELSYTLITGYNVKLRSAVIKRWQQLESQHLPKPNDLITGSEALISSMQLLIQKVKSQNTEITNLEELNSRANTLAIKNLELTATQTKTGMKTMLDNLGKEINGYIMKLYPDITDYREKHLKAQSEYNRQSDKGSYYSGAKSSSLKSKEQYAEYLREQTKSHNFNQQLFLS